MKKILFTVIIVSFCISEGFASFSAADSGTAAAQFLKLGAGARATAMGSAAAGLSGDSTSIYWNPAGLNEVSGRGSLTVMNAAWFEGISYDWASYALPIEDVGVFGISAQYVSYGSMQQLDDTGLQTGSFSPADMCVSLAYACKYEGIDFGANIKYISLKIVDDASAGAADLGAQYSLLDDNNLILGLAVQNIGTQIKFINEADSLPLNIKFGGAYEINSNWLAVLDLNAPIDNAIYAGAGAEYICKVQEKLALAGRVGYNTQNIQTGGLNGITAGLGVKYLDYSLDYAFVPYGNLGNTNRISIDIKFGSDKKDDTLSFEQRAVMPEKKIISVEMTNIAVSDFGAKNASASDASIISDFLRTDIVKSGKVKVVEKSSMEKIIAEAAFQQSGCTEADCAVKIGKILNVKQMIVGNLSKLMDTYFITANVIDVETGQILKSADTTAKNAEDLKSACESLAKKLLN